MFEQIFFYIFGGLLLLFALMVVTVRNPIHAALSLILVFFFSAAIWLLLAAEFLAITLVLVYVGAVMVLVLFVVMLLDINLMALNKGLAGPFTIGVLVATAMAFAMGTIVASSWFGTDTYSSNVTRSDTYSNTELLGRTMYTDYIYEFEIAGAILLVAIVVAITLTINKSKTNKSPVPNHQVKVTKKDRLKVIKMDSEKGTGV